MGNLAEDILYLFGDLAENVKVVAGNFNIDRCTGGRALFFLGNGDLAAGDILDPFADGRRRSVVRIPTGPRDRESGRPTWLGVLGSKAEPPAAVTTPLHIDVFDIFQIAGADRRCAVRIGVFLGGKGLQC